MLPGCEVPKVLHMLSNSSRSVSGPVSYLPAQCGCFRHPRVSQMVLDTYAEKTEPCCISPWTRKPDTDSRHRCSSHVYLKLDKF